ncbi:hypothetical protein GT755_12415 [Herbidospora sp. NEAU-GS84]|uniref:Uncharacterized protein n=1 Tax=Herbidospora solisilvae TaxID=2696284 RepID=A0A7C9J277_9ACTN|nr:hypothetical protein [Herbidospora solisilvae]NAS22486.1 hypothetical protein [Herbidospora solisilvae]
MNIYIEGGWLASVINECFALREQAAEPLEPLRGMQALPLLDGWSALIAAHHLADPCMAPAEGGVLVMR